ncbi:MAG TPA: hypothetical protein EYP60_06560 [bacterium (Candidatus Stahlbacteria)]|nr:hypothetical protein [Candidatus Stahlbacteria bacterium]
MKRKFLSLDFAVGCLLVGLISSISVFEANACGFMHEWPNEDTLRSYGLSDKQIKEIETLLVNLQKEKDSLKAEKDAEFAKLAKLVDADELDEAKIQSTRKKIEEIWGMILRNDVEFLLKARKILPSDLYSKIKRLIGKGEFHSGWRN